jgi:release factor glutamine methyltransferase
MAESLTVQDVLARSTRWLKDRGIESARLDVELLAAFVCGVRRLDLYLSPDRPLTPAERDRLRDLVVRRGKGEPVAYLRGRRDFHGLELRVTPDVLIPRPETETLVDAALAWLAACGTAAPLVADVGTGSGAIALAIAAACPAARLVAVDLSEPALAVAADNAHLLGLADRVTLLRSDLLGAVPADPPLDAVVSNPPYVAEDETGLLDRSVREYEPHAALFSGPDGTWHTARLAGEAHDRLRPGGALFVEVGSPAQRDRVAALLAARFGEGAVVPLPDPARVIRGFRATKG